jgi:hypothetical protein
MLIPFVTSVICGPCLAFLLINAYNWHLRFNGLLNRKPFNCFVCSSAWIAMSMMVLPDAISWPLKAFALAGLLAYYVTQQ